MDEPFTGSEPTTGEIVRALRTCLENDDVECVDCICSISEIAHLCDLVELVDRLESQEHKIGELIQSVDNAEQLNFDKDILMRERDAEIFKLTARAEQAEADIKKFAHTSHTCGHNESGLCKLAADDHGFCEKCPAWVYRGQPQEGEGERCRVEF